jgi:hypothetical protein
MALASERFYLFLHGSFRAARLRGHDPYMRSNVGDFVRAGDNHTLL